MTRAFEEERGRRQVIDGFDAKLPGDSFNTTDPHRRLTLLLVGLTSFLGGQGAVHHLYQRGVFGLNRGFFTAVAVMRFVIDDNDAPLLLFRRNVSTDTRRHFIGRFYKRTG